MSSNKPKLIFVEQFFHPEGWSGADIPKEIVHQLNQDKWDVKVFCGDRQYVKPEKENLIFNKRLQNIAINKIHIPLKQNSFSKKIFNQIYFSFIVFIILLFSKNPALIVSQTNPPLIVVCIAFISKIKNIPYIIIAMDVYPEVLIKSFNKNLIPILKFFLSPIFNISYRKASKVIALGNSMINILLKKGIDKNKIKLIPNWATGELSIIKDKKKNYLFSKWGIYADLRIIYSGNLGQAHDWETLLNALHLSKMPPDKIQIIFVSNGKRIKDAKFFAKKYLHKDSVIFKELVSPDLIPYSMGIANMAYVSIRNEFNGLVVPSKFSGYLARALPVIYVGPKSEINEILKNHNCGFSFSNNQSRNLSSQLKKIVKKEINLNDISKSAKNYYENNNSKDLGIKKYKMIMSEYKK